MMLRTVATTCLRLKPTVFKYFQDVLPVLNRGTRNQHRLFVQCIPIPVFLLASFVGVTAAIKMCIYYLKFFKRLFV